MSAADERRDQGCPHRCRESTHRQAIAGGIRYPDDHAQRGFGLLLQMIRGAVVVVVLLGAALTVAACKDRAADSASDASPSPSTAPTASPIASAIAPPPLSSSSPSCKPQLDAIRALRYGSQRCRQPEDCTVWNNGHYWDGCPNEMSITNALKLDALRKAYEDSGCTVETTASCAPYGIRGCVHGVCGGT